ncbi:Acyl-transf-3 domain-containing protein [Aphelenchoides fujianensis]|nr:Acyl-transf-3 domain-containing protein [Aphelenchoides fujianensis]
MALSGRVWQFLVGFFVFRLKRRLEVGEKPVARRLLVSLVPAVLLVVLLFLPLVEQRQATRLLVVLCTAACITNEAEVLIVRLLTAVGDVSFGVYLVHWPLLEFFHYEHVRVDFGERRLDVSAGLVLICASFLLGLALERVARWAGGLLSDWQRLGVALLVLYVATGWVLGQPDEAAAKFRVDKTRVPPNCAQLAARAADFFERRAVARSLAARQSLVLLRDFAECNLHAFFCDPRAAHPTAVPLEQMGELRPCTGIMHAFRDLYSNITLLGLNRCMFVGQVETHLLGSMYVGHHLRRAYNHWLQNRTEEVNGE